MRRLLLGLLVIVFVITIGTAPARAQSSILLGTSNYQVVFTGTGGGNATLRIGGTSPHNLCGASNCIASFPLPLPTGTTGHYSLGAVSGVTVTKLTSSTFDLGSTPISFCFSSGANCTGTKYVTGTLTLTSLTQTTGVGIFYDTAGANLTITGGTLAGDFLNGLGQAIITLGFTTNTNLSSLASGHTLTSRIASGTVDPTPEPASMLLFGSGLLAAGFALRRRVFAQG
jgi:hypothetical protein